LALAALALVVFGAYDSYPMKNEKPVKKMSKGFSGTTPNQS